MSDAAPKKTPLYDEHVRLGAKMIPFGDWIMPVQYSSILDEHQAVRSNLGIFDISHMGQLVATGPAAALWLIFAALSDPSHHFYLLFPPLIWIAIRSGMAGATVAMSDTLEPEMPDTRNIDPSRT